MTSNHHAPYDLGYTRATMVGTTSRKSVTGGVYKARERIHRSMLTCDY